MSENSNPDELPELLKPRAKPLPVWARILAFVGGILFLILGFIGWLVPVITGIPFYVAGLVLLGMASSSLRARINQLERRLPLRFRRLLRRRSSSKSET